MQKDASILPQRILPSCLLEQDDRVLVSLLSSLRQDDWTALIEVAFRHQVMAMLARRLMAEPLSAVMPPSVFEDLRRYHFAATTTSMLQQQELQEILTELAQARVRPVVYKGAALAHSVYPSPACRQMTDIDLWIANEEMDQARQVLEKLGYRPESKDDRPLALQRLYGGEISFYGQDWKHGLIELHWGVFAGEWLRRAAAIDQDAMWQRVVPANLLGQPVYLLSPEDHFIAVVAHIAVNQRLSKNAFRSLLDVALLAQQGLDWDVVIMRAREWRLATVVGYTCRLVNDLFEADAIQPGVQGLPLSSWHYWLISRFVDVEDIRAGRMLWRASERYAYLLTMVDSGLALLRLLTGSFWPDRDWLRARYGHASPRTRARHLLAALRGQP